MKKEEIHISEVFPASPADIYHAFLTSEKHSAMTGGEAHISAETGAQFDAWDGYISGQNVELEQDKRILQTWRTVEFGDAGDSKLEIVLHDQGNGTTKVELNHTELEQEGAGAKYEQGWIDHYFEPMKAYFGN